MDIHANVFERFHRSSWRSCFLCFTVPPEAPFHNASRLDLTKCDIVLRCQVDKSVRSAMQLTTSPWLTEWCLRTSASASAHNTIDLDALALHCSSAAMRSSRLVTRPGWNRSSCET